MSLPVPIPPEESAPPGRRRRFLLGVGLMLASYPLWGAMIVLEAAALRHASRRLAVAGVAALVANWICFGLGLLIAGRPAAHYTRRLIRRWLPSIVRRRRSTPPREPSP